MDIFPSCRSVHYRRFAFQLSLVFSCYSLTEPPSVCPPNPCFYPSPLKIHDDWKEFSANKRDIYLKFLYSCFQITKFHLSILKPNLVWFRCAGVVGWSTALLDRSSRIRFPMGVIGIFHWFNSSGLIMVMGTTHPLTEMNTWDISWGVKAAGV